MNCIQGEVVLDTIRNRTEGTKMSTGPILKAIFHQWMVVVECFCFALSYESNNFFIADSR
jgi:hypothetical protein